MKVIFITHPNFMKSKSMPLFANMLKEMAQKEGIYEDTWCPKPVVYTAFFGEKVAKWLGYIDQYLIFPFLLYRRLSRIKTATLFVFTDQALGPWMPLFKKVPHVVHCHDLLALRSALGQISQNKTGLSGRIYQSLIKAGFQKASHFICITEKTRSDLCQFGKIEKKNTSVVHNPLHYDFFPMAREIAAGELEGKQIVESTQSFLLHISAGQWYKNLEGVIELYNLYSSTVVNPLPLVMVIPNSNIVTSYLDAKGYDCDIRIHSNLSIETIHSLYSAASIFLFPSHQEGFGWPLIEAQACGCRVLTTTAPPMNEIAGDHSYYVDEVQNEDIHEWAKKNCHILCKALNITGVDLEKERIKCLEWAKNFTKQKKFGEYLKVYDIEYKKQSNACMLGSKFNVR
ncbi:glycosyltransferase [Glaciecola siphonariae]|uniref:Glycosyltransferase n=1 Tax=Glaciecola siphonariae TaxID=521012 RepID=A0ABV9LXG7_9ALTE